MAGIALLWKRSLSHCIKRLNLDDDRITGVIIELAQKRLLTVIALYLPSTNVHDSVYTEYLDRVMDIWEYYSTFSELIIVGDFNAQVSGPRIQFPESRRGLALQKFMGDSGLCSLQVSKKCKGPCYTYEAYDGGPRSLIDHILISDSKLDLIEECLIVEGDGTNIGDHFPVVTSINCEPLCLSASAMTRTRLNWQKVHPNEISETYGIGLATELETLNFNAISQSSDLDDLYSRLTNAISRTAKKCIPESKYCPFLKPYWKSGNLKQLHVSMRDNRKLWIADGKPRGKHYRSYYNYKEAKRVFRLQMRKLVREAEFTFFNEVDKAAEVDQNLFWALINRNRKKKGKVVSELKVGDKVHRTTEEMLNSWSEYFTNLYSKTNGEYDGNHEKEIDSLCNHLLSGSRNEVDEVMSEKLTEFEVKKVVKGLPNGKACGHDNISYEHLKHGGSRLITVLTDMFNAIYRLEYVPQPMKLGLIFTLHKGINKYEDDRRNHRGITLLPVISKVHEKLILQRHKRWIQTNHVDFPVDSQNAYQEKRCSLMTSMALQECINYNLERSSKVYVCLLDSATAFDSVWHNGLFVKLHNLGFKGKLFRYLLESYSGMNCCVIVNGRCSAPIPVERSVRQGSILGSWYYLAYIDDLGQELKKESYGALIGPLYCGSPFQADDVALISISPSSLQDMINTCVTYSQKWRFDFNHTKTKVLVFGETQTQAQKLGPQRKWTLNNVALVEVTEEKHVGIMLNTDLHSMDRTVSACKKAKGTLISLIGIGVHKQGFSALTGSKMYHRVVLPRALYGCELWYNLSHTELEMLERMHRFSAKLLQDYHPRTRTVIALSMLGWYNMNAYIDRRKLLFLGRLCRLDNSAQIKQIFLIRLHQFFASCTSTSIGYISDVVGILEKYRLCEFVKRYMTKGCWPDKKPWRSIVDKAIHDHEAQHWTSKINTDRECQRFQSVTTTYGKPHIFWILANKLKQLQAIFIFMAKLCTLPLPTKSGYETCAHCSGRFHNSLEHFVVHCDKFAFNRECYWMAIVNQSKVEFSSFLYNLSDDELIETMLGKPIPQRLNLSSEDYEMFLTHTAKIWNCLKNEPLFGGSGHQYA
jgi:hypothetical protein